MLSPAGGGRQEIAVVRLGRVRACDGDDVKRKRGLDPEELTARAVEQPHGQVGIEHVVVHGSIRHVVEGASLERLPGQLVGNAPQVAQLDELPDVRRVVLRGRGGEVRLDVLQGGHGAPVVEGVLQVRQDEDEMAVGPDDPSPFGQGLQRVGDVLERV